MPTAIEFIADRLPRVTVEDVRRFADTVEIRDATAFAAELQAFVHERAEAVTLPANLRARPLVRPLHARRPRCAPTRAGHRMKPTSSEAALCCWKPSTSRTTCRPPSCQAGGQVAPADLQGHPRASAAGAERWAARSEAARLAARPGKAAVDPNRASGGRGYRSLDDLPRTVRTARRLGRSLAGGCGDAWHDRRRGRGRVQRAGRSGALKRDRHEPRAAFVPDRCR